METSENVLMV